MTTSQGNGYGTQSIMYIVPGHVVSKLNPNICPLFVYYLGLYPIADIDQPFPAMLFP